MTDVDLMGLRQSDLEREIGGLKKELNKSPQGTLVICTINGKHRWYHQRKKKEGGFGRTYLGLESVGLAKRLARKAYIRNKIADMENELKSIKRYLNVRKKTDYDALLAKDSPYRELLSGDSWELEDYDKNTSYPENLIVKAPKGDIVRSKSEALIANALYERGIPYRYECALTLRGFRIYPDFTVKRLSDEKIVIWEHFGLIDDPEYFENMTKKMANYIDNGYIPGVNLIMTFETRTNPLTVDEVNKVIEHYLI